MSVFQTNISTNPTFNTPRPANPLAIMTFWMGRAKQRRQLTQLDDDRLNDLGITYAEAMAEAAKPFWQA